MPISRMKGLSDQMSLSVTPQPRNYTVSYCLSVVLRIQSTRQITSAQLVELQDIFFGPNSAVLRRTKIMYQAYGQRHFCNPNHAAGSFYDVVGQDVCLVFTSRLLQHVTVLQALPCKTELPATLPCLHVRERWTLIFFFSIKLFFKISPHLNQYWIETPQLYVHASELCLTLL